MKKTVTGGKRASQNKNYWEIKIPKLHFSNNPIVINPYVAFTIFALVFCMFFLGMFTNKMLTDQNSEAAAPTALADQITPSIAPSPAPSENVGLGHFPVLGNKNAKVTMVEFGDLRCPFCKEFFSSVEPQIMKNYVDTGKVRFAFRHYAFLGPASVVAANAAECANEQGKFWPFHDYLYKNQPDETDTSIYSTSGMTTIAKSLGMDPTQFSNCLSSDKYQSNVTADTNAGNQAEVNGTPTFFINGQRLVGALPYAQFKAILDQELKDAD